MVSQIKVCAIYSMQFARPYRQCVTCGNCSLPTSLFLYHGNRPTPLRLSLLIWNSCRTLLLPPFAFTLSFCHCSIIFSMEGTSRKRPRYSCPDLNDDAVDELIDRCDVITSASMAGSFKTILDSTNHIITSNPRVQERFDLPYLLCRDPGHWRGDDGSLALCKLMPLDNDTCDVKMPSLEGKAWASAN